MNKTLLSLLFLLLLVVSRTHESRKLNEEEDEDHTEPEEIVEDEEDSEHRDHGKMESHIEASSTVGEDLIDQGELCWIIEAEEFPEVYECSYHCFYNSENWDEIFETEVDY